MSVQPETYKCTLSDRALKQAKDELNENPKDRLSSVQKLREWLEQQPHINCRKDTDFLLRFLRTAKFSQLRAREIIIGYMTLKVEQKDWYTNWDPRESMLARFLKAGLFVILPGYSKSGMKVLIYRYEKIAEVIPKDITPAHQAALSKTWLMLMAYCQRDENIQVSGMLYIMDFTNFPLKAMKIFNVSETREIMRYQGNVSGRFKGFWFYNPGTFASAMLSLFRPFLKKKLLDRIRVVGDNIEKMYEEVPMHMMPEEYLPDEYTGPNAGSFDSITETFYKDITSEPLLSEMLHESDPKWGIDKSKIKSDEPASSFRKLNID